MRTSVLASATITANGNGDSVDFEGHIQLAVTLNISAASGTTPTLDVKIEDSQDGVTWATLASFAQKTAAGTETLRITTPFHRNVRASYTVGGTTPSFTATVKATAK